MRMVMRKALSVATITPLVTCECAVVALPPPCNYHKHGVEYSLCPAGGGNRR